MTVRSARHAEIARALETALIAAGGAVLFTALHIPAAPILGAMTAVAGAALAGRRLGFSHRIRAPQLAVMGMAAGASVSPATLAVAAAWPFSIVALVLASALMQLAGYMIFRRFGRFDPLTAFLAAAPGSLSAVLMLAEEEGADVPKVVVPQTIRVTGIVAMTPFLLYGTQAAVPVVPLALVTGLPAWILLVSASAAGWFIAHRLRWPLPAFLGVLTGSIAVHVAGTVSARPPAWLVTISLVGLGGVIGSRFSGLRMRDIAALLPVSLAGLCGTAVIGVGAGILVGHLLGIGAYAGLLAFAPGSMETMIAVSLTLNIHPAYVAAHHVARTLVLLSVIPLVVRRSRLASASAR